MCHLAVLSKQHLRYTDQTEIELDEYMSQALVLEHSFVCCFIALLLFLFFYCCFLHFKTIFKQSVFHRKGKINKISINAFTCWVCELKLLRSYTEIFLEQKLL